MRALIVLILISVPTLCFANDKEKAASWIAKAAEFSNLKGPGSKPFRLRVRWKAGYGTVVETGSYQLLWKSPDQWREELRIGDNLAIRSASGGQLWSLRGDDYLSYPAYQLENMLAVLWGLGNDDPGRVTQLFTESIENANSQCVKFERKDSLINRMCFSSDGMLLGMSKGVSTNAMVDAERMGIITRGVPRFSGSRLSASNTYDFMQYAPLESKLFPRHMLVLSQKVPTLEAFVEDVQYMKPSDSALEFAVPDGARPMPACRMDDADVERQAPLISIPPQFTAKMSRFIHFGGAARVYGVVGPDGTLRSVTLILSETKLPEQRDDFGEVAAEIVQNARYKPLICAGIPQAFGTEEELILRGTVGGGP